MKLIIGLGNPGKQYENTRHNIGFIIMEKLKEIWNFSDFQPNNKFNALISEGKKDGTRVILAMPQTFMNLSGQSVRAIMDFYKLSTDDIIVIHDDLDITFGSYKISFDSSAAGHNGVINIIEQIGSQKFKRLRVGIEGAEAR